MWVQEFDAPQEVDDGSIIARMEECLESQDAERRADERRCRREYVFRDKRSGFDRRHRPLEGVRGVTHRTLVALRDKPRALLVLLVVVNALNLTDFALTLNALSRGATEANPVMATLFNASPIWAGVFKTFAIFVATAMVWESRRYRKALVAAIAMLLVFAAIFIYHMVGLLFLT
jgi:hypothetical protein